MLSPSQSLQYQKESVERALTCANCGQKLHVLEVHVLEVHVCSDCCAELMSDPNSSMYEEEDDE
ncbi:protein ninF [Escherichia coli]|uniref:protein NinF n=1 Tax=Escherichia coli TaxID=562 RepID=UPI0017A6711B|nr:protein NinF [Escherichia coli]EFH4043243.1 protein ninF [Escherichia coli]EGI4709436.1 protein ninF [Escherichia coli]EJN5862248.1 protein ninF [Escherichia coli]MDF7586027.1 protein ninF [Escherichia coli]